MHLGPVIYTYIYQPLQEKKAYYNMIAHSEELLESQLFSVFLSLQSSPLQSGDSSHYMLFAFLNSNLLSQTEVTLQSTKRYFNTMVQTKLLTAGQFCSFTIGILGFLLPP